MNIIRSLTLPHPLPAAAPALENADKHQEEGKKNVICCVNSSVFCQFKIHQILQNIERHFFSQGKIHTGMKFMDCPSLVSISRGRVLFCVNTRGRVKGFSAQHATYLSKVDFSPHRLGPPSLSCPPQSI